jgi:hypothetical protein
MTDPFDRIFSTPEPLAPPQGHFDAISRRAKRRRMRQVGVVSAVFVLVVGVGTTAGAVLHQRGQEQPPISATGTETPVPQLQDAPASDGPSDDPSDAKASLPDGTLPLPSQFKPYSVSTVVGTTYVLGSSNNACSGAKCAALVRSTDNRQGWRTVPAPKAPTASSAAPATTTPDGTVREVRFATQMNGYAYGGALYSTHNGGTTWRSQPVGGAVLDLAIKGTTAYALVARCSASCDQVEMLSTDIYKDGWAPVAGVQAGKSGQLSFGRGGIAQVGNRIYTYNASKQWKSATAPCQATPRAVTASASSTRLFALCPSGDAGAGSASYTTRYSDDNGQSWTNASGDGLRLSNVQQTTFTAASSRTLVVGDSDPSIGSPSLQVSRNAGGSYSTVGPEHTGGWRYVGASSASQLVALPATPDGKLYVSNDDGSDWQNINLAG